MVTHFDEEYKLTKLIKQDRATLNEDFKSLANWIDQTFDVHTMNIIYDTIEDKSPRIQIIFEFAEDQEKFHEGNAGIMSNFDSQKQQAIASQFRKDLEDQDLIKKRSFFSSLLNGKSKYKSDDLLVVFSAFEPKAKEEANESIPKERIQELKQQINNKDIWEIVNSFATGFFFFYTDAQVKENSRNGFKEELTDRYYNLLKQFDEFDYFKREGYTISLDSKENFDKNYQSSWFYYFR